MPNSNKITAKPGFLTSIGIPSKRWASEFIAPAKQITQSDSYLFGSGGTTVASLISGSKKQARTREALYSKFRFMESDPIISSALRLIATASLGGHETTGDVVFLEKKPETKKNKRLEKIADEIILALQPLFNKIAFQVAFTGLSYGDAYARLYTEERKGVVDLYVDEMVHPSIVQAFERGNRTAGFAVFIGNKNFERLDVSQMARLRMPRTQFIPQYGVMEKSLRIAITENDINNLPVLPAMVGGSILYNAEEPYDNLTSSLLGLVGQRWIDSIDEQILTPNLTSMTIEQQKRFVTSIKNMLTASKKRVEEAVSSGRPVLERIRHIIPTFAEKQLTTITPSNGGQSGRAANISIEDVMVHARLTAGAIGVDLSMLGFADQLAGGLGEGGFFRTSAQSAELSRTTRAAMTDFFYHIMDIHTLFRYGFVFKPNERPLAPNFYGSISALEAEKQRTNTEKMNSGLMLTQAVQQWKDLGATKEIMETFLSKNMMVDEDLAKLYATIVEQKDVQEDGGDDGFGGQKPSGIGSMDSIFDDYSSFDGIGQSTSVPIPAKTVKWMGFEGSMSLKADLDALAKRHPEYYSNDPDLVLNDIQFVLANPDDWFVHHGGKVSLFRERKGRGSFPLVRIELDRIGESFVARSVYVSGINQVVKKIKERNRLVARLGRSGQSSGPLTIAEYLNGLGNGS